MPEISGNLKGVYGRAKKSYDKILVYKELANRSKQKIALGIFISNAILHYYWLKSQIFRFYKKLDHIFDNK